MVHIWMNLNQFLQTPLIICWCVSSACILPRSFSLLKWCGAAVTVAMATPTVLTAVTPNTREIVVIPFICFEYNIHTFGHCGKCPLQPSRLVNFHFAKMTFFLKSCARTTWLLCYSSVSIYHLDLISRDNGLNNNQWTTVWITTPYFFGD